MHGITIYLRNAEGTGVGANFLDAWVRDADWFVDIVSAKTLHDVVVALQQGLVDAHEELRVRLQSLYDYATSKRPKNNRIVEWEVNLITRPE